MNPRLAAWEVSVKWICEQIFKNADVFNAFSEITTVKTSIRLGNSMQELLGGLSGGFGVVFCTGGIRRAGREGKLHICKGRGSEYLQLSLTTVAALGFTPGMG